ncbi:hypothetical protein P3T76_009107 [Phytophthora citrophthora]|uniref:Uncharacterized protein n=1 Tax=Phytophthora citrophthora TaxID=4793 RepID=A0AAD9GIH9_9STRA|nr:hypothetical protein P3T76_009107 [Phytophthora citrophthora]
MARVSVNSTTSDSDRVVARLTEVKGFPILELSATENDLDVVLFLKERVEQVLHQGSGAVRVYEDVLILNGPVLTLQTV